MIKRLIWNDMRQNKLLCAATVFFMAIPALLPALTVLLAFSLLGAIDSLMDRAVAPDYMQMHTGTLDVQEISRFAAGREEIKDWQICRFLNLENSRITLGDSSLADSTQDNGLCVRGERFDYLLDTENHIPEVPAGEVYVPVCYRTMYDLAPGDVMRIGDYQLRIAGFLRDALMNSMMASSKRFLVNRADYDRISDAPQNSGSLQEEYLVQFRLRDGTDMDQFAGAYADRGLPANGPVITRPLIRMMNALSDGTMIFVLFLLSIVILFISLLCIRFMLLLQMERDRKEAGMLKALGVGKKDIRRLYFAKYLVFSGCGAPCGLLAAALFLPPMAEQLRELYGARSGGVLPAALAAAAVLAVEAMILLPVRHSLKRLWKLSALEAVNVSAGQRTEDRGKYAVTGLVAAACTLLVLIPGNLYSTMSAPEFVTCMGIGNSQIRMDVRQTGQTDDVTTKIALALERDAQVSRYAVLRTTVCPAVLPDGKTVNLNVETGSHDVFPVDYSSGKMPADSNEIALSSINAKELGLSVGDCLRLIVDEKEADYTVCGIYSDITNGGRTAKAHVLPGRTSAVWSVVYASLAQQAGKEAWMEQYQQMGAGVTDIADYVKDTYGQTLVQVHKAGIMAMAVAALVITLVVMLFMRLIVEKNRYTISLHKALGFTSQDLKRMYFIRGICPVLAGICAGIVLGSLTGERLCAMVLQSFGADSFRFVTGWGRIAIRIPAVLAGPAVLAVLAGIWHIRHIRAYECCMGRE